MKISRKSLEEKGWMFQFLVDRALADDAEKVYNLLGFEVLRLPVGKPWLKKTVSFSYEKPQASAKWSTSGQRIKRQIGERTGPNRL